MQTRVVFPIVLWALLGLGVPSLTVADDGGRIFADACTACHRTKKQPIDKTRLTREGWNEAVERMINYGAEIPKGKLPELLDFLAKTHGPAGAADEVKK